MTLAPLVLVPGLGSDEAVWRPVIERLGDVAACAVAETRLDAIPGATLHVIPGSGHLPPIEKPEAVAALLRDWLR